jgi:flavin reductase (DIM6/NTAB) family NADH-FMN oxidoreductase RutF
MIQENVHRYFATTVGLVTTKGSHGENVMAVEWTMQVSYEPMLIAIFIHDSPTLWNIKDSNVFGVNIASDAQANLANIAGGYSGTEIEKLTIPHTFETYPGEQIDVPMLKGCVLNAECKVRTIQELGDHIMVVGEAVVASFDEKKYPLIYTRGNYRKLAGKISSGRKSVRLSPAVFVEMKKMSAGQFVLRGAAAVIKKGGKTLFIRSGRSWALPVVAIKGHNYRDELAAHLVSIGIEASVQEITGLKRLVLKSGRQELRANFIVYRCELASVAGEGKGWFARPPKNTILAVLLRP